MKKILYFEVVDIGIRNSMDIPCDEMLMANKNPLLFNGYAAGVGTDAESALENMLVLMQDSGFNVSGLKSQIKEEWEPSQDKGDGENYYYHFGINFGFEHVMSELIARWDANDDYQGDNYYVELMKNDDRYYCDTPLGRRNLDAHTFENDDEAIWYVDGRVKKGKFDPPPLVWSNYKRY